MNWTKEIPTVDGWYSWCKSKDYTWISLLKSSKYYSEVLEDWTEISKESNYEFYGPLEEPK